MSFSPKDSAVELTPEQEQHISTLSMEEVKEYLKECAVDQGLVTRDVYSPDVLIPTERPTPKRFARTVTINGVKRYVEANSEDELNKAEIELYRSLQADSNNGTSAATEQSRDSNGRFVSEEDASAEVARRAELDLKFRRGELSVEQYLAENPAVLNEYMKRNFNLDAQEIQGKSFEKSWADATSEFLAQSDWPGGDKNQRMMVEILEANNLQDSEDKVAALREVYDYMRKENLLTIPKDVQAVRDMSTATDPEAIRQLGHVALGLPEKPDAPHVIWGR